MHELVSIGKGDKIHLTFGDPKNLRNFNCKPTSPCQCLYHRAALSSFLEAHSETGRCLRFSLLHFLSRDRHNAFRLPRRHSPELGKAQSEYRRKFRSILSICLSRWNGARKREVWIFRRLQLWSRGLWVRWNVLFCLFHARLANRPALVTGELTLKLPPFLEFSRDQGESGKVSVAVKDPEHPFQRAMWGMYYSSKCWQENRCGLIIAVNF